MKPNFYCRYCGGILFVVIRTVKFSPGDTPLLTEPPWYVECHQCKRLYMAEGGSWNEVPTL